VKNLEKPGFASWPIFASGLPLSIMIRVIFSLDRLLEIFFILLILKIKFRIGANCFVSERMSIFLSLSLATIRIIGCESYEISMVPDLMHDNNWEAKSYDKLVCRNCQFSIEGNFACWYGAIGTFFLSNYLEILEIVWYRCMLRSQFFEYFGQKICPFLFFGHYKLPDPITFKLVIKNLLVLTKCILAWC